MSKIKFITSIIFITILAFVIRFYQVTSSPPAPYWEEVALGYDAYSILETGKDHHGNPYPIVAFESFGDWKPAGYFYAVVPFIKLLGLNILAIRLPSIIAGTLIVATIGWLIYLFTDYLNKDLREKLALISMFLASISPWLIQFSRAAWEVNLATLFILLGIVFAWQSIDLKHQKSHFIQLIVGAIFLILSMYVYHSARVIAPTLGLFLGIRFFSFSLKNKVAVKKLLMELVTILAVMIVFLLPFINALGTPVLGQRVAETTIFSDLSIIQESNYFQDLYGNTWWSKLIFHRYWFFSKVIISQFFSHFSLSFLFLAGDAIARHSSQYFALFYPFELIFLLIGSWILLKKLSVDKKLFILLWLVIGVLPAAISRPVPHSLRILPIAPVFILLITLGLWQSYEFLAHQFFCFNEKLRNFRKHLLVMGFLIMYLLTFGVFYKHLLVVYPQLYGHEWQIGYKKMIKELTTLQKFNPDLPVYITREQGRPAMYYWFYTQADPREVQATNKIAKKDQGEFLEFKNIKFVNTLNEVTETPAITAHFVDEDWRVTLKE